MRLRAAVLVVCGLALAGCAAAPAPQPQPRPITDQTMGGKFGTGGGGAQMTLGADLPASGGSFGCLPGRGTFQRGTLICPGQGG